MLTCIAKLTGENYCRDMAEALAVCDKHEQLALLIGNPYAMTDELRAEVHLRAGEGEQALDDLARMVRSLTLRSWAIAPWLKPLNINRPTSAAAGVSCQFSNCLRI